MSMPGGAAARGKRGRPDATDGRAARLAFLLVMFGAGCAGYADRQVLGLVKPALDQEFGWQAADYANMATAFQLAIAAALPFAGWFIDRAGLRAGFAVGLAGWSLAAMLHAASRHVWQFIAVRAALGAFESVGTPAAMKTIAVTYAPAQRGLVIGIINLAGSLAAIATPLVVPWVFGWAGWRGTILLLGGVGLAFCVAWLALPAAVLRRAQGELGDAPPPNPLALLREKPVIGIALAKFFSDQAWWFFLYWIPDFFHHRHGLDVKAAGAPVAFVYAMAALGALAGGVLPAALARLGIRRPQSAALLIFALAVAPVALASWFESSWAAALVIGLALFAHQGFATGVFATATRIFPAARVASVIGTAALFGNLGGAISQQAAGACAQYLGTLAPMFAACALSYPLGWLAMRRLLPRD